MLTISVSAAEGIRGMLSALNPPAEAGVRLALDDDGGEPELVVSEELLRSDHRLSEHGVELHVASEAAAKLDGKLLDAQVERGVLRFRLLSR